MIRVCLAGATGWTGSAVAKGILQNSHFQLSAATARKSEGQDIGVVLGLKKTGLIIESSLERALSKPVDVLIEYTHPQSVKENVLLALSKNVRVVIGASGLTSKDFDEINEIASKKGLGVIACGNFSITAALAKYFSVLAAQYLPTWEIIDYADEKKPDAPSGTTRELAEELSKIRQNEIEVPIQSTMGMKDARGATYNGTQLHSVRLPGYKFSFETLFGLPDERLTIRHDAGTSASPYVEGTLLAAKKVMDIKGLVRGLDTILFENNGSNR